MRRTADAARAGTCVCTVQGGAADRDGSVRITALPRTDGSELERRRIHGKSDELIGTAALR